MDLVWRVFVRGEPQREVQVVRFGLLFPLRFLCAARRELAFLSRVGFFFFFCCFPCCDLSFSVFHEIVLLVVGVVRLETWHQAAVARLGLSSSSSSAYVGEFW